MNQALLLAHSQVSPKVLKLGLIIIIIDTYWALSRRQTSTGSFNLGNKYIENFTNTIVQVGK